MTKKVLYIQYDGTNETCNNCRAIVLFRLNAKSDAAEPGEVPV
jgi:hypothetical protein